MPRGTNPTLEIFLQLLYPWDDDHKSLWKSVSWSFPKKDKPGEVGIANFATQTYDDLIRLIETRGGKAATDVWVATGTQRMCSYEKYTVDGYPKAERKISNIVTHNSIYLDIDVKPDAYATSDDAFAALDDFATQIGLPETTMEVLSGSGGVHAYWCTNQPMPIEAWIPLATALRDAALAYGLKFDPGVTINPAGILRAPTTFNWKTMQPKPVRLMEDSSFCTYDYQQLVGALGQYIKGTSALRQPAPKSAFTQNFTSGMGAPPVAIEDVAKECGVIEDILDRGGDGDPEPLWNLALMLASFTEDPRDAAHKLSQGDGRYTAAETDKKLAEKITARASNSNIGWPQCASFSPLHPACQTCAHFAEQKSPLSFARKVVPIKPVAPSNTDPLMPFGYWRNADGHVLTTVAPKKGDPFVADVLGRPILDAAIDSNDGSLVFKTRLSGVDKWGSANVHSNLQPNAAAQQMAGNGIYILPSNYETARNFLVSWMSHLQNIKKVIAPATYGWTDDGKGFTFDQTIYTQTGQDLVFRGSSHDKRFCAKGELKPWQDALQLVYGNAPLETIVATAFAAPLVDLAGSYSVVVSVYSALSGIGKTTAMMLAQSVWGNPREGMSALADTTNSVMKKVADLKNLPIYWDELKTTEQLEKIIDLVFQITQGKAKSRLTREITQASAPSFTTMFAVASNYGISDTVYANTDGTEAGGLRVFEMEAQALGSTRFADYQARELLKPIEQNYGVAGAAYAEFIARNKDVIKQMLSATSRDLDTRYSLSTKERFWNITMTTLIVGAELANAAKLTRFDVRAIDRFLDETLKRMRSTLKAQEHTTLSAPDAVNDVLTEMMAALRGKHLLITDRIHYGSGKNPLPVDASETGDLNQLREVWMQYGSKDGRIKVRVKPFNKWLREHRYQPQQILRLLQGRFFISSSKGAIGVGVPYLGALASQRSECYDFTPKTPFSGSNHGSF